MSTMIRAGGCSGHLDENARVKGAWRSDMKGFLSFGKVALFLILFGTASLFAQEGILRITSVPEGVSIEVAGKSAGKTPVLTVLKPGKYGVKATLAGYTTVNETVEIVENEVTRMSLTMDKLSSKTASPWSRGAKGSLRIVTDRTSVDVYIDGERAGSRTPLTVDDLSAGLHQVILVSGDRADSSRVFIQSGKTATLNKSFEEDASSKKKGTFLGGLKSRLDSRRQALPAQVTLQLAKGTAQKDSNIILGEGESLYLSFQYRKEGTTEWVARELLTGNKEEDTFTLEKGTYDILITYALYKEPTGLVNILLGSKKEKVKEKKETIKKEFKADTGYTYVVSYDASSGFAFIINEKALETVLD